MASLLDITSSSWTDEVEKSKEPVILVCWAGWSGPSKQLLPVISDLADGSSASAKFAKLDADAESSLASNLQVLSVPQVLSLVKGQVQKRIVGSQSKEYYRRVLGV
jgi:thioredoxin 1